MAQLEPDIIAERVKAGLRRAGVDILLEVSSLTSNDKAEILDVQRRWVDAEVSGNVDRIVHLCTEDVVCLPQGAVPLRGRQAIGSPWSIENPRIASVDISDVEIAGSGDTAYKVARFETCFAAQEDSTTPQPMSGYHVWILRRNNGGEWRVAFFTWTLL